MKESEANRKDRTDPDEREEHPDRGDLSDDWYFGDGWSEDGGSSRRARTRTVPIRLPGFRSVLP